MIDYAKEKVILAGMILGGILTLTSCGLQERGDVLNTAESREIEEYTGDTQTEGEDGGAAAEASSEMAETIPETEETYLAELDIHPLYAAFLRGEISVPNPFESGSELSFFDDREYAREEHVFEYADKSFSLVDVNNDGVSELIFKIFNSPDELMYILGVQEDRLICYDIQETHTTHMSFGIYSNGIVTWGQNYDGEEEIYYTYDEGGVPHELIHFVREGTDSESDLYYDCYYRDGDETAKCSLQNDEEYEALVAPYEGGEPEWFFCDSFADIPME
ncbi:MAG: hypothetical protein K2H45_03995 [Acetatifactor sp.]|nr:hypothetical protein [Acetatifactor sp.]